MQFEERYKRLQSRSSDPGFPANTKFPTMHTVPNGRINSTQPRHRLRKWRWREVLRSSAIEKELDGEEIVDVDIDSGEAFGQGELFSWDKLLADDGDDEMPIN